jgi:hypothetical protein
METLISKSDNSWRAETVTMLNGKLQLRFTTRKASNGSLYTYASVGRVDGDFVSYTVGQDFFKSMSNEFYNRVTAKVVEAQHKKIDFDAVIKEASEFYHL